MRRRHAAPRLEAPRHLRRGGARVLRVAQRADARAELAGRPGGQLRPGAEGAPHRVLLEAGAGEAGGARALPGRGKADPAAHPRVEAPRTCSRGCSGARTCALAVLRGQGLLPLRRAGHFPLRLQQLQEDLVRQAGQALAPVLLPQRLAPPPQHLVLLRQLSDPGAPPQPQPAYCAGLLMATFSPTG